MTFRELIWAYPMTFAVTVCVTVTALGMAAVWFSFSRKPDGGDDD